MEQLRAVLGVIFATSPYSRLTDRERARTIYLISVGLIVLATVMAIVLVFPDTGEALWQRAMRDPSLGFPLASLYVLTSTALLLTRIGRLNAGAVVLVITWSLSFGLSAALTGLYTAATGMILISTVLLPALLLRTAGLTLGVLLTTGLMVIGLMLRPSLAPPLTGSAESEFVTNTLVLAIFVMLVYAFIRFAHLTREESALEAAEERFRLSEVTSQITRRISNRLGLADTLTESTNYIVANYPDVYHAQIFLVDESGRRARLVASTGEAGRKLLELKHQLEVGSQSVIGQVTASGKPVIARARALGTIHRPNEYLPDTRVEAAFPLIIGDRVIGALDLQSSNAVAFTQADQPVFQTLAEHIAIAIDNARLFEETAKQVSENKRLAEQSQQALRRVEELNRRLTGRAWSEFLGMGQRQLGLDIDFESDAVWHNAAWTPELEAAAQENTLVERVENGRRVLVMPVQVRGEVIGAMEFELDADGMLPAEDRQLIEEVSQRFGLAVENARLFAESQRIAQREALINEVGARLQATSNVETTLTEAARSLQHMFKGGRVSIRLGEPPSINENGKDGRHD
jgi:GAF domain-containing protein